MRRVVGKQRLREEDASRLRFCRWKKKKRMQAVVADEREDALGVRKYTKVNELLVGERQDLVMRLS